MIWVFAAELLSACEFLVLQQVEEIPWFRTTLG